MLLPGPILACDSIGFILADGLSQGLHEVLVHDALNMLTHRVEHRLAVIAHLLAQGALPRPLCLIADGTQFELVPGHFSVYFCLVCKAVAIENVGCRQSFIHEEFLPEGAHLRVIPLVEGGR